MAFNTNKIAGEYHDMFELYTDRLVARIESEGIQAVKRTDWKHVQNIYAISNHYEIVCLYRTVYEEHPSALHFIASKVKGRVVSTIKLFLKRYEQEQKQLQEEEVSTMRTTPKPIRKVAVPVADASSIRDEFNSFKAEIIKEVASLKKENKDLKRDLSVSRSNEVRIAGERDKAVQELRNVILNANTALASIERQSVGL